jgi:hypothetical protein
MNVQHGFAIAAPPLSGYASSLAYAQTMVLAVPEQMPDVDV